MRRLLLALAACVSILAAGCGDDDSAPVNTATLAPSQTLGDAFTPAPTGQSLESAIITFETDAGPVEMRAEIADEPGERQVGLMNRQAMEDDRGMIFVYEQDSQGGFWMQNTYIPLTIAFVRADGTIITLVDMEPLTTDLHNSPEPYRYAVEANRGWFTENGIEVGDVMDPGFGGE